MNKSNLFNRIKNKFAADEYDSKDVQECYHRGWINRKEMNEILYKKERGQ